MATAPRRGEPNGAGAGGREAAAGSGTATLQEERQLSRGRSGCEIRCTPPPCEEPPPFVLRPAGDLPRERRIAVDTNLATVN